MIRSCLTHLRNVFKVTEYLFLSDITEVQEGLMSILTKPYDPEKAKDKSSLSFAGQLLIVPPSALG